MKKSVVRLETKEMKSLDLKDLQDVVGGPVDGESVEGGGNGLEP